MMMADITLVSFQFWFFVLALASRRSYAQTCSVQTTPWDQQGPFYVPNSPFTSILAPNEQLNDPLQRLEVHGRVLSSTDCELGVANVTMEVWYAGDQQNFYRDDQSRGQMVTNECGEYSFTQVFPALYPSRPIYHNHIRLSRGGQELLVTQMYFQGEGTGYVADNVRALQSVSIETNDDGSRKVQFDLYVDAEGSSACENVHSPGNATTGGQENVLNDKEQDSESRGEQVSSSNLTRRVFCSLLSLIVILLI